MSTAEAEVEIDLAAIDEELVGIEDEIVRAPAKHNEFLKELGMAPLPLGS